MTNANPKQGRRGLLLLGFGGSENLKTLNKGGDTKAGGDCWCWGFGREILVLVVVEGRLAMALEDIMGAWKARASQFFFLIMLFSFPIFR